MFYFCWNTWHREEKDGDASIFLSIGPISLFCAVLVGLQKTNLDLVFLAMIGMFLCMRGRMRGLVYSLIFLGIGALIKHAFFLDSHGWQLGIETSVAIGLGMTALAADGMHQKEALLLDRVAMQKKTIQNLEEDVEKSRENALQERVALNDRLTSVQKELDENVSELSSLQILNDVLRKTSSSTNQEKEKIAGHVIEKEKQVLALQDLLKQLQQECSVYQQTVQEREFDLNHLQEEMHELTVRQGEESGRVAKYEEDLSAALQAKESAEAKLLQVQAERDRQQATLDRQSQEHFDEQITQKDHAIAVLQEQLQALSQTELLYHQLKKQFEEKNRILHQTRRNLFYVETVFDAMKIDQDRQNENEPDLWETKLISELSNTEEERLALEQENEELHHIVQQAMTQAPSKEIIERLMKEKTKKAKPSAKKKKTSTKEQPKTAKS